MSTHRYTTQKVILFSALVFVTLSLVLFLIASTTGHFEMDSTVYQAVAENFYFNNTLHVPYDPTNAPVFPLGYPLFMGLLYKVFGTYYAAIIWAQVILSLLTLILVFRIARIAFDTQTAYIAVLLMACNGAFLIFSQMILSEVLLAFVLTFFVERFFYFLKTDRLLYLIQATLLFSLSLLIKSIALLFVPVVVYVLKRRNKNYEDILIFLVLFSIPLFVYMFLTYYMYGVWAFTPQAYVNLYHYFLPKVIAQVNGVSFAQARDMIPFTGTHSLDFSGWDQARQMFWEYCFHYPFTCLVIWLQNMCKTVCGLFITQLKVLLNPAIKGGACSFASMQGGFFVRMYNYIAFGTQSRIVIGLGIVEAVWLLMRYCLVVDTFFTWYTHKNYNELMFFGFFIFVCTFITGFDGCFRFRMAFEALLTVLAAAGLSQIYKKIVV